MSFRTYFDASAEGLSAYLPVGIFVLIAFVAVWWTAVNEFGRDGKRIPADQRRQISRGFAALAAVIAIVALVGMRHRQVAIARIFAQRDFTVVEGAVSDFQPSPVGSNDEERFRVGEIWFSYRAAVDEGGFHQTRAHGGPIRDGRIVRIVQDRQGRILKLDLAD